MRNWKRLFTAALVAVVAVGFMCVPAGPAFAAKKPVLEAQTFWVGDPFSSFEIKNFNVEKDTVTSIKSSKPSVLHFKKDEMGWTYGYTVIPKKVGKVKVTVKCTVGGKDYTLSQKCPVKKYPAPIKTLKVNKKKVTVSAKKNAYSRIVNKYKKDYARVQILPKSNWKIIYAKYDMTDLKNAYKEKYPKSSAIKKGIKINYPEKYKQLNVVIVIKNKKTDEVFDYFVQFNR